MPDRFQGRVAFVTGAARGFGEGFCRALGREGASVVVTDIDEGAAKDTAADLAGDGIDAFPARCDVADEDEVQNAVQLALEHFGRLDVLVNNAGKHLMKYKTPFSELPRHEVRALFDVNVMGLINCSVACLPALAERGGVIINIASIAGHTCTTPYGVSKLTVRGLTVAFAHEFADEGIRVNAISPGLMATESAMDDLPRSMIDDFVENRQLIHRLGRPSEIVDALLFLGSDEASFITGETLMVSGGYPSTI